MIGRAREQDGIVMVGAVAVLTIVIAFGLSLTLLSENQQRAGAREQSSEVAFNIAEAALNAQVGELSSKWPATEAKAGELPFSCTEATSTATNYCPTAANLSQAYPTSLSPATCPSGTPPDAWGSALTNRWTTYVRDDLESAPLFNSAAEENAPRYDANGNEKLWVRAVGVAQCTVVSVITLVARQQVSLNFPHTSVAGNWFKITNQGKKVIVNTAGEPPVGQPGEISMRCGGAAAGHCEEWNKEKEQVSPNTTGGKPTPSVTLNEEQLAAMKAQAQAAGTFHSAASGNCPKTIEEMGGLPAYIEGCGELFMTGGVGNSKASPGFCVLADGTLTLKGNAEFWGVIYARNPSNLTGPVVTLGGTAQVRGAINVDGEGGIEFGSSKANMIYEPKAIYELKTYAGATPTRDTFRVLPANQ
jgi:Tfp pilus assembly protein PilX